MSEEIIDNEYTKNVWYISEFGSRQLLTGHSDGTVNLWKFLDNRNFCHERFFHIPGTGTIEYITPLSTRTFLKVTSELEVTVQDVFDDLPQKKYNLEETSLKRLSYVQLISNNLIAISGDENSIKYEFVNIWDLSSGECIHEKKIVYSYVHGILLRVTPERFLVTMQIAHGICHIWHVTTSECTLLKHFHGGGYSMAQLPIGSIVLADREMLFFNTSDDSLPDERIYPYKEIENHNVIDKMFPIGIDRLLIVDRSNFNGGTIKLWNYDSEDYEILGNSRVGSDSTHGHILIENIDVLVSHSETQILIHKFPKDRFAFPEKFAEIRKNSRILSQGYRDSSSIFSLVPKEIIFKIILMTADDLDAEEILIAKKVIRNYFCVLQNEAAIQ